MVFQLPALRAASTGIGARSVRLAANIPRHARPTGYRFLTTEGSMGKYDNIILSKPADGVAMIQLNRPKALNGASAQLSRAAGPGQS